MPVSSGDAWEQRAKALKEESAHRAELVRDTAIVHDEFARWFAPDLAGKRSRYKAIAKEIWSLWKEHEDIARPC